MASRSSKPHAVQGPAPRRALSLSQHARPRRAASLLMGACALALVAGCSSFDPDLRGRMGNSFDTSQAALQARTAPRPQPDARGVISYPNYQVAVARRDDRLSDVAARVGLPAAELARYNGVNPDDRLRAGEVIALPRRVAESGAGPIRPAGEVDIAAVAGRAIDGAAPSRVETTTLAPAAPSAAAPAAPAAQTPAAQPAPQTGAEPQRHRVARGETAYTISRLYDVSVRALAEWNGLGPDFGLREGQILLIPVAEQSPPRSAAAPRGTPVPRPGVGSDTPTPPSASKPLPATTPPPAAAAAQTPPAPDLSAGGGTAAASQPRQDAPAPAPAANPEARMAMPVSGNIIRDYAKGRNEGIDIAAPAGTPIRAAADGTVAAITSDAEQVPIIVVKHPGNLLTVYANVGTISVKKGDRVSRGAQLATVRAGDPSYVHFEVREGFDSVDPTPYLK